MHTFTLHWSPVPNRSEEKAVFALWPSPANDDACFREAGFTDFGDGDDAWDADAEDLLTRLLAELTSQGTPHLISKPVERHQRWYRRWFAQPEPFGLRQQIELPMQWDELPDCVVSFGESGVSLRTGNGHEIFWISMPHLVADSFPDLAGRVAAEHPLVRTDLRWERLYTDPA